MLTKQQRYGNWNEIKGRVKEQWGELNDDDLERVKGDFDQLIALVHEKTGAGREAVESFVESAANGTTSAIEAAGDSARQFAAEAGDTVQQYYGQAAESFAEGFESVQDQVRNRPTESVIVTFTAGIITGALLGVLLKSRS